MTCRGACARVTPSRLRQAWSVTRTDLVHRRAQHAVRRVRKQRGGARLAVLEHGGHGGTHVAVLLRVRLAGILAGGEGGGDGRGVARRGVGGREALGEGLGDEGLRGAARPLARRVACAALLKVASRTAMLSW